MKIVVLLLLTGLLAASGMPALSQTTWYMAASGAGGNGTKATPFTDARQAVNALKPGDTLILLPGTYRLAERFPCPANSITGNNITIKGASPGTPLITRSGTLMRINQPNIRLENLTFDAQMATEQSIEIHENGHHTQIKRCEIRNGGSNGISIRQARGVLIEDCRIHHMLRGSWKNQKDAHGIKASNQLDLIIRGCEIYQVSGDCIQSDPSMRPPLWNNLLIENCKLWTAPLEADAGEYKKGEIPGENAIDTKTDSTGSNPKYRATITIRNVEAYGFVRDGFIRNRAAFNLKHGIVCTIEGAKIHHCQIAIRARGAHTMDGKAMPGATISISGSDFRENEITLKPEHNVSQLQFKSCSFRLGNNSRFMQNEDNKGLDRKSFVVTDCTFFPAIPAGIDLTTNKAITQ